MALHPRVDIIEKFLDNLSPHSHPNCEDNKSLFFLSLIGDLFIQGYRVFQKINSNTMILSLMQYSLTPLKSNGNPIENLPQYKIVDFQMDVISDKNKRAQIFKNLLEIAQCIDGTIEINIIYLKGQKYSVMNKVELQQSRQPDSRSFYKPADFLPQKKGYKNIDAKTEGTRLHGSIEYYLKGCADIRNIGSFRRQVTGNDQQTKFTYDLNKVLNTLKVIVGKQIIKNDYWIMNSQKWMRKKTQKVFKRFDLILRNQDQICIIDWKFSKNKAEEKIHKRAFVKKNELYLQLAKKDYKSDVQLKFYCIHPQTLNDHHHKWTEAYYDYKITQVQLDQEEEQDVEESNDEVVFLEDQVASMRVNQLNNFFSPQQNRQNAQTCLQQFNRKYGINDQNQKNKSNKTVECKKTRKQKTQIQKIRQLQKIKEILCEEDDDFFIYPRQKQQTQNQINEEKGPRRGKRSRPVEFIERPQVSKTINSSQVKNKKIKPNEDKINWDQIISISSKGQIQNQDNINQILEEEEEQNNEKEENQLPNFKSNNSSKPLYFDPKQFENQAQHRHLILIEKGQPPLPISSEESLSPVQKQIQIEYGDIDFDFKDNNMPNNKPSETQQIIKQSSKQSNKEITQIEVEEKLDQKESILVQKMARQEQDFSQENISNRKSIDLKNLDCQPIQWISQKEEERKSNYQNQQDKRQQERRKKNCRPKSYIQILSSDDEHILQ